MLYRMLMHDCDNAPPINWQQIFKMSCIVMMV